MNNEDIKPTWFFKISSTFFKIWKLKNLDDKNLVAID